MNQGTRDAIRQFTLDFAKQILASQRKWTSEEIRRAYPFHALFFPDDRSLLAFKSERSIVTRMGQRYYPQLAELIVRDQFEQVSRDHTVEGSLNDAAVNMIEQIVTELRAAKGQSSQRRRPNHEGEMRDILNSRGGGVRTISVVADLYVADFTEGPLFIEIKGPTPNLDIAAESKKKILYYLALASREGWVGAKAFVGFHHNPFGSRAQYSHPFTKQILDLNHEVLIGQDFWDYLGSHGTYEELLEIIDAVRHDLYG